MQTVRYLLDLELFLAAECQRLQPRQDRLEEAMRAVWAKRLASGEASAPRK